MDLISRKEVLDSIPKMMYMQSRVGKTILAEFIKEWIANIKSISTIESRPKGKWVRITQGVISEQYMCPFLSQNSICL